MVESHNFDVVVVGASLAGCATAILLGREGFEVALIDKHADDTAFKRLCGHYIQASATPVVERLELDRGIEEAGGVRNGLDFSTRWGIIASPLPIDQRPYGFSLRREKLDPLIRRKAAEIPTVTYLPGLTATALVDDGGMSTLVEVVDRDNRQHRLRGTLLVGADGRSSKVAEMAGVKERRARNNRFCYASYFTDVRLPAESRGRMWMREPNVMIAAPQDEGLTVLAVFGHRRDLARFGGDRLQALKSSMEGLPGLDLSAARLEDKIIGYKRYDLISRAPVVGQSIALVGDAALSSDPTMGVGCGWAFQSAAWLADSVAPALRGSGDLGVALSSYRKLHRRNLRGHHLLLTVDARARPLSPVQRVLFSAGTSDPKTARLLAEFGERSIRPSTLLKPKNLARAATECVRGTMKSKSPRQSQAAPS